MGLFDRFKTKNHSEEFKKAYENNKSLNSILQDWLDNGKHDALFGLVMTILVATRRDKAIQEALTIFKTSTQQKHEDNQLYKWYENTALKLLDNWADDEINNNLELKNKFEENKTVKSTDNDYDNLTCKYFARKFKQLFDQLADAGIEHTMEYMDRLNKLVEVWTSKCPDDSNLASAYVILHGPELTQEDISEYVYKYPLVNAMMNH